MIWQPVDCSHPDSMSTLVPYLRGELSPVRVSVSLRGWSRPDPVVQVHRIGGALSGVNDTVEVQVDVRDKDYDSVWALTAKVRTALAKSPGVGVFRRTVETHGPDWSIDQDDYPRIRMEWLLTVPPIT